MNDRNVCKSCPASLVCLDHPIVTIYQCSKCKCLLVHFKEKEEDQSSGEIRVMIPTCIRPYGAIHSCYDCAKYISPEIQRRRPLN